MADRRAPKIKRSIPNTQGLWCVNCSDFCAQGRIDSGGRPFLGCDRCRAITFGLSGMAIWTFKALSAMFANASFRESIRNKAAVYAEEALAGTFVPGPALDSAPAPTEASEVDAA